MSVGTTEATLVYYHIFLFNLSAIFNFCFLNINWTKKNPAYWETPNLSTVADSSTNIFFFCWRPKRVCRCRRRHCLPRGFLATKKGCHSGRWLCSPGNSFAPLGDAPKKGTTTITDRLRDYQTELAQWADLVKIRQTYFHNNLFIFSYFFFQTCCVGVKQNLIFPLIPVLLMQGIYNVCTNQTRRDKGPMSSLYTGPFISLVLNFTWNIWNIYGIVVHQRIVRNFRRGAQLSLV